MTNTASQLDGGVPPPPRGSAGGMLRAAREGAGLSVDAVAQQLKLAPRQVKAIEDEDFSHLPGRTFVRGFVRNYARLVRLDADAVLAALPDAAATSETPSLQPPAADMGELPAPEGTGLGWTRWAIPAAMIAIVAALALYEFLRPVVEPKAEAPATVADAAPSRAPAPPSAAPPENSGTPLANPVAPGATPDAGASPAGEPPAAASTVSSGETAPATIASAATPTAAAPAVPETTAPAAPAAAPAKPVASTGRNTVVLAFRDYSWTEVKDRNGVVLMSRMNAGGTTQSISAEPPIDLVIGNSADVTLTFRGARIDLAPYTRQNVARLTLR